MAEIKPKSNAVITTRLEGSKLVFVVKDAGETALDMAALHADIAARALIHGLKQRVSDRAAIPRDTATGKAVSPSDKLAAMAEIVDWYNAGNSTWDMPRVAGEGFGRSYLLNALCELYANKTRAELGEWIKTLDEVQRKALEASPRIKPKIDAQRAKGSEGVDADDLLAGLEG